ncbi:MAG: hypothetical protein K5679_12000 [Lachnospiraceae bacterium]|nr:hypothetical protein [Lachnospiraceae bacterium]
MKSRITKIIAAVGFVIIAYLCLAAVYGPLSWKDTSGDKISSLTQLYETEDNLVDVAFLGSSLCYFGSYPAYYWEDLGIAAFDIAVSSQDRISGYHHLKELFKTQSPKVVFVEAHDILYDKQQIIGNEYRNMLSMKPSVNSLQLITEGADKKSWLDYLFRFPIIHSRYKELEKDDFELRAPNYYGRGEYMTWVKNGQGVPPYADGAPFPVPLDAGQTKWLEDLKALSVKEGFDLVLYFAPGYMTEAEQGVADSVAEYGQASGIPVIDFNKIRAEINFDYDNDLIDSGHSNAYGARKMADYFEKYLSERYSFTDHRGDSRYWQWDKDLEWYYSAKAIHELKSAELYEEYISMLSQSKDVLAVISLEGDYTERAETDYYASLVKLGMTEEEYRAGGKWIYKNGELTKVHENDLNEEPFFYQLSNTETLKISYNGDYMHGENILINKDSYYSLGDFMGILTYDCFTGEVIEVRGF